MISHTVKEGEVIIVFKREFEKFGMRYEKINHLTYENILVWVNSNFWGKKELNWLKVALDSLPELRTEREEKERREEEKRKFRLI